MLPLPHWSHQEVTAGISLVPAPPQRSMQPRLGRVDILKISGLKNPIFFLIEKPHFSGLGFQKSYSFARRRLFLFSPPRHFFVGPQEPRVESGQEEVRPGSRGTRRHGATGNPEDGKLTHRADAHPGPQPCLASQPHHQGHTPHQTLAIPSHLLNLARRVLLP